MSAKPIEVYQYPKCSTCRKALKWLDAQGIEYRSLDIVERPPSKSTLAKALKADQAAAGGRRWGVVGGPS